MCNAKGSKIVESVGSYLDSRALCPDSGATDAMCPCADMFLEHTSIAHEHKHVRLGNENQRALIHGIGTMGFQIGDKATVHGEVLHVPELSSVLLSSRVHRRITRGCSFVADHSGCFLTHPKFAFEVDDEGDCTIECTPASSDVTEYDFDSRLCVNQRSSKQQQTCKMKLTFDMMHRAWKAQLSSCRQPIKSRDLATKFNPDSPTCSIPESGIQAAERMHTLDLQKMFGCRKLKNWKHLEHTGTGVQAVNDLEPPIPLGEMATIKRNPKGKLLDRPANRLHAVGMDIGCGNGDSPGGCRHALTLIDCCTRYAWTYGLKSKSAESIIQALWSFFLDAGGCPTRIRCDFDPSFVKGKVAEFLKAHQIKISSSPPGRQSQNSLVERQWQTATAMARALLMEAQLPRRFWFWALREAIIRMNMLPCRPQPQDASVAIDANELTAPHELCCLEKPDYRTLFSWGSVRFYRKLNNRQTFDSQTSVGTALGRSNQTNGMIFWNPSTSRMNVTAACKLDPSASCTTFFPTIQCDGSLHVKVLRGGEKDTKEPFPPGTNVSVLHQGTYHPAKVMSVPLGSESQDHSVEFSDSGETTQAPIELISGLGKPTFDFALPASHEKTDDSLSSLPTWLEEDTHVAIHHDGKRRRGFLQNADRGWTFVQKTSSGRTTWKLDLSDLPMSWENRLTEGSLELGWQQEPRAWKVSARGLRLDVPRSFSQSMAKGCLDRQIWLESCIEELEGLQNQDAHVVISKKECDEKHSGVQMLPSMNVQVVKKDENGNPDRAKSRIVALGNFETAIWEKSDKHAPVLRDESSRLMTSVAIEMGRTEKQGDCKNTFVQSCLPADETIVARPPKGCPISKPGESWLLKKTLYGLRRSPCHWYQTIKKMLPNMGLSMSDHDPCIFAGKLAPHSPPICLGLCVDDFKHFSASDETERLFEQRLATQCTVDFMGEVSWFLGCKHEWERLPDGRLTVSIAQTAKSEDLTEQHGMGECNPVASPCRSGFPIDGVPRDNQPLERKTALVKKHQSLVGGLLWIQRQSRPDLTAVAHLLSQCSHDPSEGHCEAGKRVLTYLKGTLDRGIRFTQGGSPAAVNVAFPIGDGVCTDANWGPQDASHPKGDETVTVEEAQSFLGHVIARMGGPLVWGCTRETATMSLGSCESETCATNEGAKSALTARNLSHDLGLADVSQPTPLCNDNRGCVDWTKGVSVSRNFDT